MELDSTVRAVKAKKERNDVNLRQCCSSLNVSPHRKIFPVPDEMHVQLILVHRLLRKISILPGIIRLRPV
jgi:hypothetical protein